jgi:hypothetical protein
MRGKKIKNMPITAWKQSDDVKKMLMIARKFVDVVDDVKKVCWWSRESLLMIMKKFVDDREKVWWWSRESLMMITRKFIDDIEKMLLITRKFDEVVVKTPVIVQHC